MAGYWIYVGKTNELPIWTPVVYNILRYVIEKVL